jgi:acyl-CoA synthetase (AMP-forming)/AMP-acid ligase II/3-oxoacyl-(acyl-carrier-protein) synthase
MIHSFKTLAEAFIWHADKQTRQIGITFIEGEQKEEFLSYYDLCNQAKSVLLNLQRNGLKPGDELVLQFQSNKNFIVTFWACILGGIIPVPITFNRTGELKCLKVWEFLKNPYLVTDYPGFNQLLASLGDAAAPLEIEQRLIFFDHLRGSEAGGSLSSCKPGDIAFIQFSSGSTGNPKGVIDTHQALLTNLRDTTAVMQVSTNDRFLSWMPLTHDLGLIFFHMLPLVNNNPQYLLPPSLFIRRPSLWMLKTSHHKASILSSPNFGYRHFLNNFREETFSNCNLESVRFIINGAEPISAKLCKEFSRKLTRYGLHKNAIRPGYGLAEAALAVTFSSQKEEIVEYHLHRDYLDIGDKIRFVDPEDKSAVSFVAVGTPVGITVKITDNYNHPLPDQTVGYIKLKGPSITPGYYNNPGETAKTIDNQGWLNTGDLGLISNGQLVITGRAKELIIIGGINYYPHDIERNLENIPGFETNKIAAAGMFNETLGREELLLFVRFKKNKKQGWRLFLPKIKQAKEQVLQKIGLIPDQVIPVNKIPKTTSGKLQRFKLAQEYREGVYNSIIAEIKQLEQELPGDKPSEIQPFLIKTAKQLLDRDNIDINHGLMDQGFTSMHALQFQEAVNKHFNLNLPISLIFDFPTINHIAELISNQLEENIGPMGPIGPIAPIGPILSRHKDSLHEPIAVIGIGCRFPPDADTPGKFWQMLEKGANAVTEIPARRWNYKDFYSEDADEPGKMYTRYGAFLKDLEKFDHAFFSITPREAEHMDPHQRILLEVCCQALENAGVDFPGLNHSNTGVFIGISPADCARASVSHHDYRKINQYTFTGSAPSTAVGRISYVFGLQGPTYAIDTACSSSLAAVHAAVQSLSSKESDMALAGGINLMLSPEAFIASCKLTALSKSHQAKPFDNDADGYIRGEGCGVIVLKRLSDAQKNKDNILAVIKGSAVNHDGKSSGFTAPNGLAQQKVISTALANANISPLEVDYIEAHGSGTRIGDPQEVNALASIFSQKRKHKLVIGSVKSNIGHLEAAAGIAGLIKTILALEHKKIPASLHFVTPNQHIPWNNIPITVANQLTHWKVKNKPRIAGVSSFGLSGTNAHVIVEEAPTLPYPLPNYTMEKKSKGDLTQLLLDQLDELETVNRQFDEIDKQLDLLD